MSRRLIAVFTLSLFLFVVSIPLTTSLIAQSPTPTPEPPSADDLDSTDLSSTPNAPLIIPLSTDVSVPSGMPTATPPLEPDLIEVLTPLAPTPFNEPEANNPAEAPIIVPLPLEIEPTSEELILLLDDESSEQTRYPSDPVINFCSPTSGFTDRLSLLGIDNLSQLTNIAIDQFNVDSNGELLNSGINAVSIAGHPNMGQPILDYPVISRQVLTSLQLSPSGRKLAFAARRNVDETISSGDEYSEVFMYILDIDSDLDNICQLVEIYYIRNFEIIPDIDWSPDETRLIFALDDNGDDQIPPNLHIWDSRTSEAISLNTPGENPDWSPDNFNRIAFYDLNGYSRGISLLNLLSNNVSTIDVTFDDSVSRDPDWSPNGRFLTYETRLC